MAGKNNKSALARKLGISRGSLYYKKKLPEKDEELRHQIETVQKEHPAYGHRRIALEMGLNKKRVLRVMNKYNLKPLRRAKKPVKKADQNQSASNYPDITKRLSPIAPHVIWTEDFTYISFKGNFIYLASVNDRFTREVLGINIMTTHTSELVIKAFESACMNAESLPDYTHSDQGSEYRAEDFTAILSNLGIKISMTPKASPWRNGSQESFFSRFKCEFGDFDRFDTLAELVEEVYVYMAYYNNSRIHTSLSTSPVKFRKAWYKRRKKILEESFPHVDIPPDPPGYYC